MYKKIILRSLVLAVGLVFGFGVLFCFAQEESITITTYYPAPYGVYNEMRANKMVIGDPNSSSTPASSFNGGLTFKGLASDPASPDTFEEGTIYYNNTEHQFRYRDDTAWQQFGGGCSEVPGANQSNCWLDIDGDSFSPRTGDCDETCATCFLKSTTTTSSEDGKDQNCNGVIDEVVSCIPSPAPPPPKTCIIMGSTVRATCGWTADQPCNAYCGFYEGKLTYSGSCRDYDTGYSTEWFSNWNTCSISSTLSQYFLMQSNRVAVTCTCNTPPPACQYQ